MRFFDCKHLMDSIKDHMADGDDKTKCIEILEREIEILEKRSEQKQRNLAKARWHGDEDTY